MPQRSDTAESTQRKKVRMFSHAPHLLFAICASLCLSCGSENVAVMPTETPASGAEAPAVESEGAGHWTGHFRISGAPSQDDCDGAVYLAAEHLLIDAGARTVHADVIDRRYDVAEISAAQLVAEGRFPTDVCPESTLFERWTLQREGDAWTGTLVSTWPDSSECTRACSVQFAIRGQRLAE